MSRANSNILRATRVVRAFSFFFVFARDARRAAELEKTTALRNLLLRSCFYRARVRNDNEKQHGLGCAEDWRQPSHRQGLRDQEEQHGAGNKGMCGARVIVII